MPDRTKRPAFKEIVRIIDEWIKFPEKLNDDYIKVRRYMSCEIHVSAFLHVL